MVLEFLQEQLEEILRELSIKKRELIKAQDTEKVIEESIRKIQNEADIDLEVFSPRIGDFTVKEKIRELYERRNQTLTMIGKLKESIDKLSKDKEMYQAMIDEVNDLKANLKIL